MTQSIEVVIPVHDPARPVARGIASVLDQRAALAARGVDLHVTVVLHNLAADSVSGPGFRTGVAGVTYLSHSDGVASPAGPRNYALGRSGATYLSFLDSDDYLEPGSLLAWWEVAEAHTAAAVIAPLRTPAGNILPSPRIRPSKPRILHPLRDGLAYRSVPYGLLRRESLLALGFSYTEGVPTGEDIEPTLRLWFRSGAICYPYGAPAYRQTDDSGSARVTSSIRPLRQEFAWLEHLLGADWLQQASTTERRAIAHKILRVHGIGALLRRADAPDSPGRAPLWDPEESLYWRGLAGKGPVPGRRVHSRHQPARRHPYPGGRLGRRPSAPAGPGGGIPGFRQERGAAHPTDAGLAVRRFDHSPLRQRETAGRDRRFQGTAPRALMTAPPAARCRRPPGSRAPARLARLESVIRTGRSINELVAGVSRYRRGRTLALLSPGSSLRGHSAPRASPPRRWHPWRPADSSGLPAWWEACSGWTGGFSATCW